MFLVFLSFLIGVLVGGVVLYQTFLRTLQNNAPLHVPLQKMNRSFATSNLLQVGAISPRKILSTPKKRLSMHAEEKKVC